MDFQETTLFRGTFINGLLTRMVFPGPLFVKCRALLLYVITPGHTCPGARLHIVFESVEEKSGL